MICVSIGRTRHQMVIGEHQALADRGAQLVELRLDWLSKSPDLGRLFRDRPTPVVVTIRRPTDRGRWAGTEEARQTLLRQAIISGAEYVDLEDDIALKIRRYGKTKRIISHHDFERTPDDLEQIAERMYELDPDIVKLVTMANSPVDCVRMLQLVQQAPVPMIGFCMGELGQMTRILCGKFGSPFTYATFSRERELAPGQLAFDEMRSIYRYDDIGPETRLFGVLGDPVSHSLSPKLHNAMMHKLNLDSVYLPLRVPADVFSETLDAYAKLGFRGYSVTIPHKEAALVKYPLAEEFVRQLGAANTLVRKADDSWVSHNTDYEAALEALKLGLRPGESLEGKRVLMLGSGGVARALGYGVTHAGASLVICSRTSKRAHALAEQLKCRAVSWENRGAENCDILVNCTPVGMHPDLNSSPFQMNWLRDELLVFDTIYTPEQTLLIKQAREHGCRTVTGVEMFIRQAAAQFELFTGHPASLDELRDTLRRSISAVKF